MLSGQQLDRRVRGQGLENGALRRGPSAAASSAEIDSYFGHG
jgi:hypothetical protein